MVSPFFSYLFILFLSLKIHFKRKMGRLPVFSTGGMTWGFYTCPLGRSRAAYGPWSGAAQLQGGGLTTPPKGSILNIETRVPPANG